MAFYIGNSPADTNFLLGGEKSERTLWNADSHVWPRYNFSWFDGTMEKFVDGVSCRGQVISEQLRSCETSWWHRLDFVEDVQYNISEADKDWLVYDAFERVNGKPGLISAEFFHTSTKSDRIPSVVYGVNYVECLFNESYQDVEGGKIKNPTCDKNSPDCTPKFEIPANIWFKERGAKITYRQRWEWQDDANAASPNRPSITIKQKANKLKTGSANDIVIQLISCTPQSAPASATTVNIEFKIYAMTEATDQPIYYGDNILSNFGTADTYGEIYRNGYMWLTSTGDMTLDSAATYNPSTKTWSIRGHWSSNSPNASTDTHDFNINKVENTKEGEAKGYDVSATCGASSSTRYATFTINLGAKNNWINKSLQGPKLSQAGESVSYSCQVKNIDDPDDAYVDFLHVSFPPMPSGDPVYTFTKDVSEISSGDIHVTSYKTTMGESSYESETIIAKCSATGHTGTVIVDCSQQTEGSKESVNFVVVCSDGCSAVLSKSDYGDGNWVVSVSSEHSTSGGPSGTIDLTQDESGNMLSVNHTSSGTPATYSYTIAYYEDAACTIPISNVELPAAGGSRTVYVKAIETKVQNGSVTSHTVDYSNTDATPDDISISYSGNSSITESVGTFTGTCFPVTFSAQANNESSFDDLGIVKDSDFNETLGNTNGSETTFTFHLEGGAGVRREGTDSASIRGAFASCSVGQNSTVTGGVTDMDDHTSDIDLTKTCTPSSGVSDVDISMTFSNGIYTVKIKANKDYNATTSAGSVPYSTPEHPATLINQRIYSSKNTVEEAGSSGTVDINTGNEYGYFSAAGYDKVLFTLKIPNVYGGNYGGVDNRITRTFTVTASPKASATNIIGSASSSTTQTAQELWSEGTEYTQAPSEYTVEWSHDGTYISGLGASTGATNATVQLSSADIADLKTRGVEAGTAVGSVTATVTQGSTTIGSLTWSWTFTKAEKPSDPKVHVYWIDNVSRDNVTINVWEGEPGDSPAGSDWPRNMSPADTSRGCENGTHWGDFVGWFDPAHEPSTVPVIDISNVQEDIYLYAKYWKEYDWTASLYYGVSDFTAHNSGWGTGSSVTVNAVASNPPGNSLDVSFSPKNNNSMGGYYSNGDEQYSGISWYSSDRQVNSLTAYIGQAISQNLSWGFTDPSTNPSYAESIGGVYIPQEATGRWSSLDSTHFYIMSPTPTYGAWNNPTTTTVIDSSNYTRWASTGSWV